VFEVDEDQGGAGEVGDSSWAHRDVLKAFPAFGQQGEAALAQASQSSQEPVVGALVRVQPDAVLALGHRGQHAATCADVSAVGQYRHVLGIQPQDREDQFTGGGHIMHAAG
jgi:hypothetical protein